MGQEICTDDGFLDVGQKKDPLERTSQSKVKCEGTFAVCSDAGTVGGLPMDPSKLRHFRGPIAAKGVIIGIIGAAMLTYVTVSYHSYFRRKPFKAFASIKTRLRVLNWQAKLDESSSGGPDQTIGQTATYHPTGACQANY
ncbi:hypothetical protein T265_15558, partial [Opisthorchis viverrini]